MGKLKITDLSAEEPADKPGYARTKPRSHTLAQAELRLAPTGQVHAQAKIEVRGPASDADIKAIPRGVGLGLAEALAVPPAAGTGILCIASHAPAWITIGLPMITWGATVAANLRYMRRK
jgi:hypothetical protein